jgi:pyruvate,water dikinase
VFRHLTKLLGRSRSSDLNQVRELFDRFQQILKGSNRVLELISDLEEQLGGDYIFDINYLKRAADQLNEVVLSVCSNLNVIADNRYRELFSCQTAIETDIKNILEGHPALGSERLVIGYDDVDSDLAEVAGGKSANIGEIRNHADMLTPDGFVITTTAFRHFMAHNELWPKIQQLRKVYAEPGGNVAGEYDREIDRLFGLALIPLDLEEAIDTELELLHNRVMDFGQLAVRSSAYGEDEVGRSFAGQFDTLLNQGSESILPAYVKVLASRVKHRVVAYAGDRVFDEDQLPMAVAVEEMIDARTAGVAYSVEPSGESAECLAISASPGLGVGVVEGITNTDYFRVSRLDPTQIVTRRIGKKTRQVVPTDSDKLTRVPVPDADRDAPCLSDEQVILLTERVLLLERYFKRPVDVEWSIDEDGALYILQCRPLRLALRHRAPGTRTKIPAGTSVLMRRQGQVAQRGIAAGRIHHVQEDDDLSDFPMGAIAVTRYTTPRLAAMIRRAAAIISDAGSPSGHLATVAREFGVPMIVNTADATKLLTEGAEVTVDAEENLIYDGILKELLVYKVEAEDVFRDFKEYHILRQLLRKIAPLRLIDPNSLEFSARNCRSYHDIVRFSHEMAVKILIGLDIASRRYGGVKARELKLPIPLGLYVIDMGGGLVPSAKTGKIDSASAIVSVPMRAILKGLATPGTWSTRPIQLGFGDLVSSLTRYSMTDRGATYQGRNLAVISSRYVNLSLRLGYHFNVIDAYVSDNIDSNYIYFRFVGGVTETERRHLRAMLIKNILERLNFQVTLSGDLVVAQLKRPDQDEAGSVLYDLGRLIGFTRQLDTQMDNEQTVAERLRMFFEQPSEAE